MADLKDLSIFNSNKGIDKINKRQKKRAAVVEIPKERSLSDVGETKIVDNTNLSIGKPDFKKSSIDKKKSAKKRKSGVGAPLQNFDRVYATTGGKPIKVSALLHAMSTVLGEKFMTESSRDEILRKALDDYIRVSMTKEDKQALFIDVQRDLALFRQSHPTIPEFDDNGNEIRSVEQIEAETLSTIKNSWGL